jgi:hypothetical protein
MSTVKIDKETVELEPVNRNELDPILDNNGHVVRRGDIYQLNPEIECFGAALMIVDEIKNWGVQGYIIIPGQGNAWVRKKWADIEWVGHAIWQIVDEEELSDEDKAELDRIIKEAEASASTDTDEPDA